MESGLVCPEGSEGLEDEGQWYGVPRAVWAESQTPGAPLSSQVSPHDLTSFPSFTPISRATRAATLMAATLLG